MHAGACRFVVRRSVPFVVSFCWNPMDLIQVDHLGWTIFTIQKSDTPIWMNVSDFYKIPSLWFIWIIFIPQCIEIGVDLGSFKEVTGRDPKLEATGWQWLGSFYYRQWGKMSGERMSPDPWNTPLQIWNFGVDRFLVAIHMHRAWSRNLRHRHGSLLGVWCVQGCRWLDRVIRIQKHFPNLEMSGKVEGHVEWHSGWLQTQQKCAPLCHSHWRGSPFVDFGQ